MAQKHMEEGGAEEEKKAGAFKQGSESVSVLRSAGMNPDGDDEAGDVADAAAAKVGLPRAVKKKWKRLGGRDVPLDDDSGEGGKPKRKRAPFRELPSKGKSEGAKKRRIGDGKMGPCADVSKLLDAMKKRKGGK